MKTKKKLSFQDLEATPEDFENAKIRISIMVPIKDLAEIKSLAAKQGKKYQPFIQEILHIYIRNQTVKGDMASLMARLEIVEQELSIARKRTIKRDHNIKSHEPRTLRKVAR